MIDETLLDAEEKMEKAVSVAKEELNTVRTGRANPAMFSRITVDYYGAQTPLNQVAEPYVPRRAERHLEKGRVVIFAGGVGMPYFSTDTAAAQRALEIGCEVVLMAKSVDGVYTADPKKSPDAKMFEHITHREVLERGLEVADATAFSLCMDNNMPIIVFNLLVEGNIARAVRGERIGTVVSTP